MNIQDEKHFVSIPKKEYEEMIEILENRKDSQVTIDLILNKDNDYRYNLTESIGVASHTMEFNEKLIDITTIHSLKKLFKESFEKGFETSKRENIIMQANLNIIRGKWWYKLFTFFN